MIGPNDIKNAVIKKLRDGTDVEIIISEDAEQVKEHLAAVGGTNEPGEPVAMFIVQVEPVTISTAAAGLHAEKNVLVDISYMEDLQTSRQKLNEMLERVDRIIRPVLSVGDRHLTIQTARTNITDGIGHYVFNLEYVNAVPALVEEPMAESLEANLNTGRKV